MSEDNFSIELINAGKRFNRDWIFSSCNYNFNSGKNYAVTGPNGSGKSTLLQALAGSLSLSQGEAHYKKNNRIVKPEELYRHLSICAPYVELIDEMTITEFLNFHNGFKPLLISVAEIVDVLQLSKAAGKQMRYYSSGMKQRVKLAQAILSNVPLVLLDEPCTNFDTAGFELYYHLIKEYGNNRLIIVCSNDENEISVCEERLSILDFK